MGSDVTFICIICSLPLSKESGVVMVKALGQLSFGIELKRLHDPDSMLFGVVDVTCIDLEM